MNVKNRKGALIGGVIAATGLLLSACGASTTSAAAANHTSSSTTHKGPYKIGLSNTFIANEWRVEMENLLKTGASQPPFNHEVQLHIFNSGNTVSDQISTIQNMISAGYNAILLDATSPTALNGVIAEAHRHGIVVVAFDNTVTSPYAYNVNVKQGPMGSIGAKWLVEQLHGHGNIIMNRGIAGSPVDIGRYNGAMSVFKKYPGIHILDQIYGQWDDSTTQSAFETALAAYPNVNGVWSEGASTGVINAFLHAHRKFVPTMGGTSNQFMEDLLQYKKDGLTGISVGNSPGMSAVAMKVAVEALEGKHPPKFTTIPVNVATDTQVKKGVNAFPNLPPSLEVNWQVPGFKFTAQEALHG
ncbi:MAG: sugar ABC transporter substrate-binding protein [Sulfobacillus acidophilus]|uniref:Sugar ABC transporter substrate-binding protein n=1 Tax=Sulfobacillus acidophilus TaxID=53633 RepID=A0A2T2WDW1_9FIRM|nr:MAG: sugar ABC transporter substrate-binding protein [Sulfobacillus acidophilus]